MSAIVSRLCVPLQGKRRVSSPPVVINADKNVYGLGQDVLAVLDRACQESIPMLRDDKPADALTVRHGPETDDYNREFIERDEKRLADLGRRTVEMYVIAHIISELEVSRLICKVLPCYRGAPFHHFLYSAVAVGSRAADETDCFADQQLEGMC